LSKRNPRWDLEEEDDAAEKVHSERIRVFSSKPAYLIYKLPLVGFCKLQVQFSYGLWYFAQKRERNSGGIYIKKKKSFAILQREKVLQKKNI
jgi:hypothetical protein